MRPGPARARGLLGEPALHVGRGERRNAFLAYELETVVPRRLVGKITRRIGEHEPLDALGRVGAEPLADHAAHGKTAPVGLLDAQVVEHGEHVTAETFHGIGALRTAGSAMAAPVIAHEPKVLRERRDLRVPHLQRGAERIRQHQHGRSFRTLDFDMDGTAVGIDHRHDFPSVTSVRWKGGGMRGLEFLLMGRKPGLEL